MTLSTPRLYLRGQNTKMNSSGFILGVMLVASQLAQPVHSKPEDARPPKNDQAIASPPPGASLHRKFKDRTEAGQFVELLSLKQTTLSQMDVLTALIREKQAELAGFSADLGRQFGLQPTGEYEFNAESGWIMQITAATNAAGGVATNKVEKKVMRRLEKESEVAGFVRVATARNVTREQIAIFAMVVAEKNLELQQCDKRLLERYGISNKSAYQYVAGELAVYELGTNKPAAGKSGNSTEISR